MEDFICYTFATVICAVMAMLPVIAFIETFGGVK
jgi:hypothetical protein